MANNAEVLREFLISLNYQVERTTEERFIRTVEETTRLLGRLGLAAAAAAGTVGVMAVNMSRSLEGLFYSSRRLGSSVEAIRSFGFAVGQMGGSSDEARASLENLARAMRDNPGVRGLVNTLTQGRANTNDTVQTMRELGRVFRSMPIHIARQYSGMLGIDERTLDAIMRGTDQFSARYTAMARRLGMDSQASARHAVEFQNALRELQLIGQFALEKLVIALGRIAPAMLQGAEQFVLWLERVIPQIDAFVTSTIGWENALIVIGVALTAHLLSPLIRILGALRLLSVFRMPGWLLRMLGTGTVAGAVIGTLIPSTTNGGPGAEREALERAQRGEDPFPDMPPLPSTDAAPGAEPAAARPGIWQRIRDALQRNGWRFRDDRQPASATVPGGPAAPPSGDVAERGTAAMSFFERMGWTREQAAGIVGNLQGESGLRPTAFNPGGGGNGAFGLAQWRGPRQEALGRFIGRDFRTATFEEQLAFVHHELTQGAEQAAGRVLRSTTNSRQAADVVMRMYERPEVEMRDRFSMERGAYADQWFALRNRPGGQAGGPGAAPGVVINQRTEVNVQGAPSPEETAQRVAREQGRVNSDIVRNIAPVVR